MKRRSKPRQPPFYVSIDLFRDSYIQDICKSRIVHKDCEITGFRKECINLNILKPLFYHILDLYQIYHPEQASAIFHGGSPKDDGTPLWQQIHISFGIFNPMNDDEDSEELMKSICEGTKYRRLLDNFVHRFDQTAVMDELSSDENEFEWKLWEEFKEDLRHKNRFFPSTVIDFKKLRRILKMRVRKINPGTLFYRARKSENKLSIHEMGPPPSMFASAGRANPKGISYLYLGENKEICRKEIKIQRTEGCTYGEFLIDKKLKVVDLSTYYISALSLGRQIKDYIQHLDLLRMYIEELSNKASENDPYLDYLATQYICEFIKNEGYEGIMFKSSLGNAQNLILFSSDKVKCIQTDYEAGTGQR